MSSPSSHALILIHGLGAHWLVMSPLARRLQKQFGRVINWSYSSLWSRIEHHGQRISEQLQQLDDDPNVERIHLITHSMGGIVARWRSPAAFPRRWGGW